MFLQYLSEAESARGNFEVALNYCDAADALASAAGKTRMRTVTLNAKGQLLRVLGRLAEAQDLYEQALAVARSLGDEEFVAGILLNLAIVAILAGRSAAVAGLLQEVAAIHARTGSQSTGQSLLEVCGGLAAELQQWDTAAAFVADAGAQALQSGLERDPADQAFVMHITDSCPRTLPSRQCISRKLPSTYAPPWPARSTGSRTCSRASNTSGADRVAA